MFFNIAVCLFVGMCLFSQTLTKHLIQFYFMVLIRFTGTEEKTCVTVSLVFVFCSVGEKHDNVEKKIDLCMVSLIKKLHFKKCSTSKQRQMKSNRLKKHRR